MLNLIGTRGTAGCRKTTFCMFLTTVLIVAGIYSAFNLRKAITHREYKEEIDYSEANAGWGKEYPLFANLTIQANGTQLELLPSYEKLHANYFAESIYLSNLGIFGDNATGDLSISVSSESQAKNWTISNIFAQKKESIRLNQNTCALYEMGCWDNDTCFYHYRTKEVCILLNETTLEPTANYREGCYMAGLEIYDPVNWTDCSIPLAYSEDTISLRIVSQADPYMYFLRHDLVKSVELPIRGLEKNIIILSVCVLMLIFPSIFFCRSTPKPLLGPVQELD